jgi:large subunit ribosomal protein L10
VPTEAKMQAVQELSGKFSRSTIVIATDFSGLSVNQLTEMRSQLRALDIEYRVVKNRIAALAATEAGVEPLRDILEGSTGLAFGYGEPVTVARTLDEFVKQTRIPLRIRQGVMDGNLLTVQQVTVLASLPPREQLLAKLLGQMNAPITGLVTVLSGPVRGLATVLKRRAEQLGAEA